MNFDYKDSKLSIAVCLLRFLNSLHGDHFVFLISVKIPYRLPLVASKSFHSLFLLWIAIKTET